MMTMNPLTLLTAITACTLALLLLGEVTQWAVTYVARNQAPDEDLQPAVAELQQPPHEPTLQRKQAAWWWRALLSPGGMFGFVAVWLEPVILLINSYLREKVRDGPKRVR